MPDFLGVIAQKIMQLEVRSHLKDIANKLKASLLLLHDKRQILLCRRVSIVMEDIVLTFILELVF